MKYAPTGFYPFLVGLLLGWIQTGLFFQLTLTYSSGFTTYLMITLCWLVGSALGAYFGQRLPIPLVGLLIMMLSVYSVGGWIVNHFPFNSQLWPLYGILIIMAGFYPGVFFARASTLFTARSLFFWENNGFIVGLVVCTILFMLIGRPILWVLPWLIALIVWSLTSKTTHDMEDSNVWI